MMRLCLLCLLASLLTACESNPPAPVIERTPQSSKPTTPNKPTTAQKSSDAKATAGKDWRPDSHVVKKGDTLFSIGLEYGYDYKEIAAANNIPPPYPIKIGQKLSFTSLNSKAGIAEAKPTETKPAAENEDGVIVSPIKIESAGAPSSAETKSAGSAVTPVLSEPKAVREPYSLEAFNRKTSDPKPSAIKPADTNAIDTKSAEVKPAESKSTDDENIAWVWPTQGKVIGGFNEANNKGIDIAGTTGQNINAASDGKVIYTGSDLRGYGKLVIIKHNKIFLSVYAHNSKITVKEGQAVTTGQKIAEMGNTDSNTVNLHFEIRHQGKSVDPTKYLPQN